MTKLRQTRKRAPSFTQIVANADTIVGLDALGRVWVYIPSDSPSESGWVRLANVELEPFDDEDVDEGGSGSHLGRGY